MEKNLVAIKKRATFASQLGIALYWTFSSAGLEHLPYKQRVGGSNPSTSTKNLRKSAQVCFFYINIHFYIIFLFLAIILINFVVTVSVYA